jgi:acyl-CoA synthetase (AMP-forming)/AMP-acid ligase II
MMPSRSPEVADAPGANIARHLGRVATSQPEGMALKVPRRHSRNGEIDYLALTFRELDAEVAAWCHRLTAAGIRPGDRTLVMVPPGLPLIAAVFALFNRGAVPVVIDPGMGLKGFLSCVASSQPRALVGIPLARLVSRCFRPAFRSVEVRVAASGSLTGRLTKPQPQTPPEAAPAAHPSARDDLAAILFTSGSTGAPKGVCYEHGMFEAQVRLIRDTYTIEPGEIDLPMLPIFALFNPALGMTTIVPAIDPRRPAAVNPAKIVEAIQQEHVTNSFGSPTLWRKIAAYCREHNISLPSLRRVLCAGAAVPADLWRDSRSLLPKGRLHSPYGATESLPIASIAAGEVESSSVHGACVGRPLREIELKIIAISDDPIPTIDAARELPRGEVGEVIVRGPVVTKTYDALPHATALAKIADGAEVWHRMGDCGYLDADGRLWFCGRKAERVESPAGTLHTEPCEQVFRDHPAVTRCALIGIGPRPNQRPALVVETQLADAIQGRSLARSLRTLARQHPHTAGISLFYFHPRFPVDVRHNAKIHRLSLARWGESARGFESDSES